MFSTNFAIFIKTFLFLTNISTLAGKGTENMITKKNHLMKRKETN